MSHKRLRPFIVKVSVLYYFPLDWVMELFFLSLLNDKGLNNNTIYNQLHSFIASRQFL